MTSDQLHQPYTFHKWTPCAEHVGHPTQIACEMCAEQPVQMCNAGCGVWPCATQQAAGAS